MREHHLLFVGVSDNLSISHIAATDGLFFFSSTATLQACIAANSRNIKRSHEVGRPGGYLLAPLPIANGRGSQSAAPAVVCALIAFVASVAFLTTPGPNAYGLLIIIANNVLPKAYAISAMWTLNSRKSIRRAYSIGPQSSSATSGHPTPDDLELSLLWISCEENDSDAESDDPRQRE
jgi:hypothetical protein